MTPGTCRLCGRAAPLVDSHVISRFVARRSLENDFLGSLRAVDEPNRVRQDVRRYPLLCANCEVKRSHWENEAKKSVFGTNVEITFSYGESFLPFAVSTTWLAAVREVETWDASEGGVPDFVFQAIEAWRQFLDGGSGPDHYAHHAVFVLPDGFSLGPAESPQVVNFTVKPDEVSFGANLGFERQVGYDLFQGMLMRKMIVFKDRSLAFSFAALGGLVLYSSIKPEDRGGWQGTRIDPQGGMFAAATQRMPIQIVQFLRGFVQEQRQRFEANVSGSSLTRDSNRRRDALEAEIGAGTAEGRIARAVRDSPCPSESETETPD